MRWRTRFRLPSKIGARSHEQNLRTWLTPNLKPRPKGHPEAVTEPESGLAINDIDGSSVGEAPQGFSAEPGLSDVDSSTAVEGLGVESTDDTVSSTLGEVSDDIPASETEASGVDGSAAADTGIGDAGEASDDGTEGACADSDGAGSETDGADSTGTAGESDSGTDGGSDSGGDGGFLSFAMGMFRRHFSMPAVDSWGGW